MRASETAAFHLELAGNDKIEVWCERERNAGRDADNACTCREYSYGVHMRQIWAHRLLCHGKSPARPASTAPAGTLARLHDKSVKLS